MAAVETSSSLTALYPAVAAVIVATIGFAGNFVMSRRAKKPDPAEDTNVIVALASALADESARADAAELRAGACEAREKARRRA